MARRVVMTEDALENYGEAYRDVVLVVTHRATRRMSASDFYAKGRPAGYHPGFDPSSGSALYDLRREDTGEALNVSLYDWELTDAPAPGEEPGVPAGPRR